MRRPKANCWISSSGSISAPNLPKVSANAADTRLWSYVPRRKSYPTSIKCSTPSGWTAKIAKTLKRWKCGTKFKDLRLRRSPTPSGPKLILNSLTRWFSLPVADTPKSRTNLVAAQKAKRRTLKLSNRSLSSWLPKRRLRRQRSKSSARKSQLNQTTSRAHLRN